MEKNTKRVAVAGALFLHFLHGKSIIDLPVPSCRIDIGSACMTVFGEALIGRRGERGKGKGESAITFGYSRCLEI
jgi:hypothetical protein